MLLLHHALRKCRHPDVDIRSPAPGGVKAIVASFCITLLMPQLSQAALILLLQRVIFSGMESSFFVNGALGFQE